MSKRNPTIYDVASRAGVSISTVSRVLNAPDRVNQETRSAVMEAIESLGFIPKAEARARALKAYHRIGVLTPHFTAPSFVQRLRGVAAALRKSHHELIIYTVETSAHLHSYLETIPITHSLDGLIVLSLQFDNNYAERLVNHGLQTVLVEYPHNILNSVEIDDIAGGRLAAEYLIHKGYQSLGFVGDTTIPEFGIQPITLRLSGMRQALAECKLTLPEENILLAPYDMEVTRQKAISFLRRVKRPKAIFAATDLQAIAILRAAREIGLRVPQELAVIGFDNLDLAEYFGLTTISQHLDESGQVAVELLLSRINDPGRPVQHIQLPLNVVERETA
ncbi:MAG TPA: LacI family DNA-binding transcriptional regulator [Anaerolineaceae bacterium]|nr:LacI family DNA-binding transcriptional regulator [Anaerolineaceae bacterium]